MRKRKSCRKVRKLIPRIPDCDREQTLRFISEHLSECKACKSLHARLQKMEAILVESKLQVNELARQSRMSQSQIIAERATLSIRQLWRLRPIWAAAAAFILIVAGASALFLRKSQDEGPGGPGSSSPSAKQSTPPAVSSPTLRELAEVLYRREAPPPDLPYTSALFEHESFPAQLLQRWTQGLGTTKTSSGGRDVEGRNNLGTPMTTKATPALASSRTVRGLADMLCRREAPSLRLPYAQAGLEHENTIWNWKTNPQL